MSCTEDEIRFYVRGRAECVEAFELVIDVLQKEYLGETVTQEFVLPMAPEMHEFVNHMELFVDMVRDDIDPASYTYEITLVGNEFRICVRGTRDSVEAFEEALDELRGEYAKYTAELAAAEVTRAHAAPVVHERRSRVDTPPRERRLWSREPPVVPSSGAQHRRHGVASAAF